VALLRKMTCNLGHPMGLRHSVLLIAISSTEWRRPIGCLKLQVIFRKRATNYRALLRKMTCKDTASYGSSFAIGSTFWVSSHLKIQSHSDWSLFKGTWQKRPRELDLRLRFEIEETTLQMQQTVFDEIHYSKLKRITKSHLWFVLMYLMRYQYLRVMCLSLSRTHNTLARSLSLSLSLSLSRSDQRVTRN